MNKTSNVFPLKVAHIFSTSHCVTFSLFSNELTCSSADDFSLFSFAIDKNY